MNLALFGGVNQTPLSLPEDGEQLIAAFGGVDLDLSRVRLPETYHLSALAFMGGVKVIVPRGTDVIFKGFSLMGGRKFHPHAESREQDVRSVVYLNAVAIMGGVEVVEAD